MSFLSQSKECGTPSGYIPATAANTKPLNFGWARACPAYTLSGTRATHCGGGKFPYRPVIGDACMKSNTGRYWFDLHVNTSDCRIGFCTLEAYSDEDTLEKYELGDFFGCPFRRRAASTETHQDDGPAQRIDLHASPVNTTVAYIDMQTLNIYVNGERKKQLWRTFIAGGGALFTFVVDTDNGMIQLFVNKKYAGMAFDSNAGLKGKTLVPCVGIGGFDMCNSSIGVGKLSAVVNSVSLFDGLY